jgi:predicted transcriptional regulator of viral defense system
MPELSLLTPTPRALDAKVRLAELGARQWGVVKREQLHDFGLTDGGISRWIDERRLHRVYPGVYAVGHQSLALEGRLAAALFYAGRGAALCGVTAGSWLEILDAKPQRIHVAVPGRRLSLSQVRIHQEKRFERVRHKGLPVTPPARTLLDIANQVRFTELRRALAEAEFLKLVTLKEVEAVLGRGKPGSAALRAALDCHNPRLAKTKKGLEEKFFLLCERCSITPPEVNVSIAGWLVDAAWFEHRVIVELDSHLAHGTPARLESDHQRDLALRAAGYTVLRYTWQQLTEAPELVVADLRRALGL